MNFLAPLFLAGTVAIALPVIFHLIRRSTRQRTVFSSLMFLQPSPPQLSRRSRLQDILLMLLRCLALVLLAFGFSRPFITQVFPQIQPSQSAKRTVILLDVSASMRRQELWPRACARAEALLRQVGPGDEVALFTFGRRLEPLVTFDQWNGSAPGDRVANALNRLADTTPGWSNTQLDVALIRAGELLGDRDQKNQVGPRQIVVITDLQEGSQTRALQGYEWPKGIEVVTERVDAKAGNNAGIQLVTEAAESAYTTESTVRVRVSNAADSKRERFQVGWARPDGSYLKPPVEVYVPPGQSRVLALPQPGTNAAADRIQLSGDDDPFDNTVFVVSPERTRTKILYLGTDSAADNRQPLFFLDRAFQETRGQAIQVVVNASLSSLSTPETQDPTLFVVTDALADLKAAELHKAVLNGKTLVFAPTTATAASTLGPLLGSSPVICSEAQVNGYAMLGEIDFSHPLFAPFADARFSDFTKIHFWKYRRIAPSLLTGAQILAAFDTGDPAIMQVPLGKGRIIVFASGWHPSDSQLALSSKFVPLLYSLLEFGGSTTPSPQQYYIGASVALGLPTDKPTTSAIVLPDGTRMAMTAGTTNFESTSVPGLYTFISGSTTQRFAINLDPSESRTAPFPNDELQRLGVPTQRPLPVPAREAERKTHLQNNELEGQQKLWRWFIAATLAVLGLETWLAGRSARRSLPVEATAA